MIRRLFATIALTTVVAVPASAQWEVNAQFHSFGSPTHYDQYGADIDGVLFQVFCVNPVLLVNDGEWYNDAWVTPFSAIDDSHVVNPNNNSWLGNYTKAAQVATMFMLNPNFETAPLSLANWARLDRQYAIWEAMGFDVSGRSDYNAGRVQAILTAAANIHINPNHWLVLTNATKSRQEFIYYNPIGTPNETVPEPATMTLIATGLAGMAAARRRRSNQS